MEGALLTGSVEVREAETPATGVARQALGPLDQGARLDAVRCGAQEQGGEHRPGRAWEIHPVTSIEVVARLR